MVLYASAVDGLFISFAINLRAHFQALQQDIHLLAFGQEEQLVDKQLADVVEYHVQLLSLSRQLRHIYTPIVFGQFFITSLEVGVIIYQIVTVTIDIIIYIYILLKLSIYLCSTWIRLWRSLCIFLSFAP